MLSTYAEKTTPFTLSPESLDWHLAHGWYRMGSTIFTSHFLFFNNRPYSAIWIRQELDNNFEFSKSQRRLLRRNGKIFDVAIAPRRIDAERDRLYRRYAEDFNGRLSPSISDSLEDYNGETVFNTWEVTVRERRTEKLVACSYFDLGDNAAASILGFYDPALSSYSLGYYTMLLEMEFCRELKLQYYYPGYVVPGYHRFDYKLRIGPVDYYDVRTGRWLPHEDFEAETEGPVEAQYAALDRIATDDNEVLIYPLFEAGLYDAWNDNYFPYPFLLPVRYHEDGILALAFDPKQQVYLLIDCRYMVQSQLLFNSDYLDEFSNEGYMTDLLSVRSIMHQSASTEEMRRISTRIR